MCIPGIQPVQWDITLPRLLTRAIGAWHIVDMLKHLFVALDGMSDSSFGRNLLRTRRLTSAAAHNSGGRGGQVGILTRGGMTGKFAAAAGGRQDEAYEPAQSPQTTMLSALTGGRAQNGHQVDTERSGPGRVEKQNYSSVPPPATLVKQDATPSYRGRGRGSRGGLGFTEGGAVRGRGGPFRGRGHSLSQPNGRESSVPGTLGEGQANGHSTQGAPNVRGATRGGRGGRGRAGGSTGQSMRGVGRGGHAAPGPTPAQVP